MKKAIAGCLFLFSTAAFSQNADCTFEPAKLRSPREVYRNLSQTAEAVSPTVNDDGGSRRRPSTMPVPPMPEFTARNYIDTEIFGKMRRDRVYWTSPASDEEFLRRIYIELTGAIPSESEVRSFMSSRNPNKRDALIDQLIESDAFTDRWTMWMGDHLMNVQVAANYNLNAGRTAYYDFLRVSIAQNKPYDLMVRELLAGRGPLLTNGPANFWVRQYVTNGPIQDVYDNLASFSSEKFLGLQTVCLSCHNGIAHLELVNSSLARRSRADFWKMAAFFARSSLTAVQGQGNTIADNTSGAYRLNTNAGNKTPRIPMQDGTDVIAPAFFLTGEQPADGENPRQALGRMLTAHPQFARATVNYIWKDIFGVGLVEPADGFDLLRQDPATLPPGQTLQATHPELLKKLADEFVASGYDLRALVRTIVQSNAYQLSSKYTAGPWDERYTPYYARHYPRRMMAEALLDAIFKSTGVGFNFIVSGGEPTVPRAMQLPDPTEGGFQVTPFLETFGRGDRDGQNRSSDSSIVQALSLMNDRIVLDRVKATAPNGTLNRLLQRTRDPGAITDALYYATVSRPPREEERAAAIAFLEAGDLTQRSEDLLYSLINRVEFLFY